MDNIFGRRLREVRKKRHCTQEELGEKCGAGSATIRSWEKGLRLPNAYYLPGICAALGVSADYLLGIRRKEELTGDDGEWDWAKAARQRGQLLRWQNVLDRQWKTL